MSQKRILVIDDDEDILSLVDYNLTKEGFRVTCVTSGEQALAEARAFVPDLIVLDLMLPTVDGLEVCKLLKADSATAPIPILMLTAKAEEADVVTGLELGADDYVTKPFSPRVLLARIRAILRRTSAVPQIEPGTLRIHEIVIHPGRHEVFVNGRLIDLKLTEFRLLHFLASKAGRSLTRAQIVDAVRGEDYPVTERSVDVQVVGLRKKLGDLGGYIETVRGVGYRFRK